MKSKNITNKKLLKYLLNEDLEDLRLCIKIREFINKNMKDDKDYKKIKEMVTFWISLNRDSLKIHEKGRTILEMLPKKERK